MDTNPDIKNKFNVMYLGKRIGTITFTRNGLFESDIAPNLLQIITDIIEKIKQEGVSDVGEVILKEPIKVSRSNLLPLLWVELEKYNIQLRLTEDTSKI
ncbi:MAG: hypothetical protein Q7R31_01445 [Candidatus Levybacteria bacterium]|nr:hypothetical protein [Candidatus Levybacteria bacterium]